jgi:hypothetical protein
MMELDQMQEVKTLIKTLKQRKLIIYIGKAMSWTNQIEKG